MCGDTTCSTSGFVLVANAMPPSSMTSVRLLMPDHSQVAGNWDGVKFTDIDGQDLVGVVGWKLRVSE